MEAMENQLVDRYLAQNPAIRMRYLYVVAWFNRRAWDKTDYRRDKVTGIRQSRTELQEALNIQAEKLSTRLSKSARSSNDISL